MVPVHWSAGLTFRPELFLGWPDLGCAFPCIVCAYRHCTGFCQCTQKHVTSAVQKIRSEIPFVNHRFPYDSTHGPALWQVETRADTMEKKKNRRGLAVKAAFCPSTFNHMV